MIRSTWRGLSGKLTSIPPMHDLVLIQYVCVCVLYRCRKLVLIKPLLFPVFGNSCRIPEWAQLSAASVCDYIQHAASQNPQISEAPFVWAAYSAMLAHLCTQSSSRFTSKGCCVWAPFACKMMRDVSTEVPPWEVYVCVTLRDGERKVQAAELGELLAALQC